MRLYSGTSTEFIQYTQQRSIVGKLIAAFRDYYRVDPQPNEIRSWENSLKEICQVFVDASLNDNGVLLEYQLPLTSKRLDCLICGCDESEKQNAVIIELKQWEKTFTSEGDNEVGTYLNGEIRDILHPSAQVGAYKEYLEGTHTAFNQDDAINLSACSFLHNYHVENDDPILAPKFKDIIEEYPIYSAAQKHVLRDYLQGKLNKGKGSESLDRILKGGYMPAKKLMDSVSNVIENTKEYVLLDEQKIVFDKVMSLLRSTNGSTKKTALIVKGGPGTGKSVIALNLLATLLKEGLKANYVTGSKSFNETLWDKLGKASKAFIKYFNSYMDVEVNSFDCLICDEAHRIREYSQRAKWGGQKVEWEKAKVPQLYEIHRAPKVSVFFIDDNQIVKPGEIGSIQYIIDYSRSKNVNVLEYELEAQFRCNGSNGFINWINNTLDIKRTANVIWNMENENYEFKIFGSPLELENAIRDKHAEGYTARVAAGFCWRWSDPTADGKLINDVVIGDYRRPWNAKPDAARILKNIPSASLWASDPNGINQVGCVYTAQGFEYDYAGIIVGRDLVYRFENQAWIGQKKFSKDPSMRNVESDDFLRFVKNTYRVLLTRGMKGCYVYFEDKETENFVRSRVENQISLQ